MSEITLRLFGKIIWAISVESYQRRSLSLCFVWLYLKFNWL